jgi:hypothetical protein
MQSLGLEVVLIGVTTLVNVLAIIVGVVVSRDMGRGALAGLLIAVLIFNGLAFAVQVTKARREHVREAAILARKAQLVALLGQEIDTASKMEYDLESYMTRRQVTQEVINKFVESMEAWRKRMGDKLEEMLPGTHGARVFLSARGDFPGADLVVGSGTAVAFGMTPGFYQYTHVRECRRALMAILAAVDSFVRLASDLPKPEQSTTMPMLPRLAPTVFVLWLFAQVFGFGFASYGVLRAAFADLSQQSGFGEGRFGEGPYGGGLTRGEEFIVNLGIKTRLLPADRTLTIIDKRRNAAFAVTGVGLLGLAIVFDLWLRYLHP